MMRLDPALSDEGPNGEESVTTVDLEKAMRQESRQLELPLEDRGEAPKVEGSGEAGTVAHGDERSGSEHLLMEEVVGRANLVGALKRVRQNKGSPGIDGMSVEELPEYLRRHWGEIRQRLLAGTYQPKPVRRQEIPKSGGGVRELGIMLDRYMLLGELLISRIRGSSPWRGTGRESRSYLGFRLVFVSVGWGRKGADGTPSGTLKTRVDWRELSGWEGNSEYLDARRSRALEPGDNRDRSNTRVRRAHGFDSAPIKLTMPFVALGAAKSLVDDFFWSRWRFEISVFDLVSIGRG